MAVDKYRDKKNRLERELARGIGKQLSMQRRRVAEILGDGVDAISRLDWGNENAIFIDAVLPNLTKIAEGAFDDTAGEVGMSLIDLEKANKNVLDWVNKYTFELVKDINETTRGAITDAISAYYTTPGATTADIITSLSSTFSPTRAEMIAVTEVTRAYQGGQELAIDEYRQAGLEIDEYWQTSQDELSEDCEECGDLHDAKRGDGWDNPPPAHPRCRCWTRMEVIN